jgi:N-carbamoyl-L-amino-acid hydrolase
VRRDALPGAAEVILELEALCRDSAGVGTVGRGFIRPNATNVVPAEVELWLEIRGLDPAFLTDRAERIEALTRAIAARRGLAVEWEVVSAEQPVTSDPRIFAVTERVLADLGLPSRQLPSGAGHDANQLAHIAPMGMVFVPSRGGRSHCPEEWTSIEQLTTGVRVLGETLLRLDELLSPT